MNRVTIDVLERDEDLYNVEVSDDYDSGVVCLDAPLPASDLDLLAAVYQEAREGGFPAGRVLDIFHHVKVEGVGIIVRGNHYDWDKIKGVFDEQDHH